MLCMKSSVHGYIVKNTFINEYQRNVMYLSLSIAEEIACADPVKCEEFCGNKAGCSNLAYPMLVLRLLPNGKFLVLITMNILVRMY